MFRLFRRHTTIDDSETLRKALFSAIERKKEKDFQRLCSENRRLVEESFAQWRKPPESILDRAPELNAYMTGLLTIAHYFMSLGEPGMMASLVGEPGDNPIVRWRDTMNEAYSRSAAGEYSPSNELLLGVLAEMENFDGNAIQQYRPKIYGLLGTNCFALRDFENANRYTVLALEECRRTGDEEGVRTYTENLALFHGGPDEESGEAAALPVRRFRREIARAQDLSDEVRYEESNAVLEAVLLEMNSLPAGSQESFRGKLYGLLGLNLFRMGKLTEAGRYTELALRHCQQESDEEGARIYSLNIAVIVKARDAG